MKIDREAIFAELEPPPGGPARLRAKLRSAGAPPPARAWWLGPVAVVVIAAVAIFAFRLFPDSEPAAETDSLMTAAAFDRLLGRDSAPYAISVRRGPDPVAVSELETRDPNVRLFHLEPVSGADDTPESAAP